MYNQTKKKLDLNVASFRLFIQNFVTSDTIYFKRASHIRVYIPIRTYVYNSSYTAIQVYSSSYETNTKLSW